jgi:peptidoglycan/LPS O-acetylase OafA/YrhL
MCHSTSLFPELPYPVHRVVVLGWHGVQLFFLASAVTLMMSWHYEKDRNGSVDVGAFFLRRYFRIAPAYYLASVLYFLLERPLGGFDLRQAAATYLFVNSWNPQLMGVTPGAWSVVPGSWSIGVEFTFYAVFPILACYITSLSRAAWLLSTTVLIGAVINSLSWPNLNVSVGTVPANNFLYFWFPNQMSVFALGMCLYFVLQRAPGRLSVWALYPNATATLTVASVVGVAFLGEPQWLSLSTARPPAFVLVSIALALFILALAHVRQGPFINRGIALLGRVSFSAYLLHVAVLKVLEDQVFLRPLFNLTGWPAIPAYGFTLICIVLLVLAGAWCLYRVVELPMIGLGKALIRKRRLVLAPRAL